MILKFINNICNININNYNLLNNNSFIEINDNTIARIYGINIDNYAMKILNNVILYIGIYSNININNNVCINKKEISQFKKNIFNNNLLNQESINIIGNNTKIHVDNAIFNSLYNIPFINQFNGKLVLINVELNNNSYFGVNINNCTNIICYQILNNNISHIKQLLIDYNNCTNDNNKKNNINNYNLYQSSLYTII